LNKRVWIFFWVLFLGPVSISLAQEKCRWVPGNYFQIPTELDSLSGIPESISIVDTGGNSYAFTFDLSKNLLQVIFESESIPDSLKVCYRTFSLRFDTPIAKRTLLADYDSTARFRDAQMADLPAFDFREELFPSTDLYKSGSLTRGISF
jgi:hypothetical protein